MKILGLTGSIAMGKSTTSKMLKRMSIPVYDADQCVHDLFQKDGAATVKIKKLFPSAVIGGTVNKEILSGLVFGKPSKLKALESIVHPLVKARRQEFLSLHRRLKTKRVILDIPLLFETNSEREFDYILVASAPWFIQRRRALSRPGMNVEKLNAILHRQTPDYKKRQMATVVIPTGLGKAYTFRRLRRWIVQISKSVHK
jgi:dephospho-CoA kinase